MRPQKCLTRYFCSRSTWATKPRRIARLQCWPSYRRRRMDDAFPLSAADLRMIAQIGFAGANQGEAAAARRLFEALQALRPDSPLPFIGLSLAESALGRPEAAARQLSESALAAHPGNGEVMAFLGLALHEAGRTAECEKVLRRVVSEGKQGEPHVALAERLLQAAGRGAGARRTSPAPVR